MHYAAEHADLATFGIKFQPNKLSRSCSPLRHVLVERLEKVLCVQLQLRTSETRPVIQQLRKLLVGGIKVV